MKIERLSADKIKVTVSPIELDGWNINPKAISPDSPQLREFIASLITQSCRNTGVELLGSNILVEARPQGSDFVFVITKVSPEFESMKREISRSIKRQKLMSGQYRIKGRRCTGHTYFCFDSLEDFAHMLISVGCKAFIGTALYRFENKFCLEVRKDAPEYGKCCSILSEYAKRADSSFDICIGERARIFAQYSDYDAIVRCYR